MQLSTTTVRSYDYW